MQPTQPRTQLRVSLPLPGCRYHVHGRGGSRACCDVCPAARGKARWGPDIFPALPPPPPRTGADLAVCFSARGGGRSGRYRYARYVSPRSTDPVRGGYPAKHPPPSPPPPTASWRTTPDRLFAVRGVRGAQHPGGTKGQSSVSCGEERKRKKRSDCCTGETDDLSSIQKRKRGKRENKTDAAEADHVTQHGRFTCDARGWTRCGMSANYLLI